MIETQIVLIAGRKENERGRIRGQYETVPRIGDHVHHEGSFFEVVQVTWDYTADPPVVNVIANLHFGHF